MRSKARAPTACTTSWIPTRVKRALSMACRTTCSSEPSGFSPRATYRSTAFGPLAGARRPHRSVAVGGDGQCVVRVGRYWSVTHRSRHGDGQLHRVALLLGVGGILAEN